VIDEEVQVGNRLGLHARAAAKFVHVANGFQSRISVTKDSTRVDGKSILGLLTLAAGRGAGCGSPPRGGRQGRLARARGPRAWKVRRGRLMPQVLHGIGVSGGSLSDGRAPRSRARSRRCLALAPEAAPGEIARLAQAREGVRAELLELKERVHQALGTASPG
jgi:phosphocarrier protein